MGRRPELLRKTLLSMGSLTSDYRFLAVNDFGDTATNDVFRKLCPHGELLKTSSHQGHHAVVDLMYEQVKTPFVLHCEDDWKFESVDFLPAAISLVQQEDVVSTVCLRALTDFRLDVDQAAKVLNRFASNGQRYYDLTGIHPQWHGYTFNPHLAPLSIWQGIGGFSKFKKERHVSRHLRSQGLRVAYLEPGYCEHIGDENSVANAPRSPWYKRLLTKATSPR